MSPTPERPSESRMLHLARSAMPHVDRPPVAALIGASIRLEALGRRVGESERRALAAPLRLAPSAAERRRRRERAAVRERHGHELAPDVRLPPVNWHAGGSGEPLLLLNGWTASGLVWPAAWVAQLERQHRVIRVDNRGTGWSRCAPAPFSLPDLADDAAAVLAALGIARASVLGMSMGGMVAQELALRHPDLVAQLFLVATMPPRPVQISLDPAPFLASLRGPAPGQEPADYLRSTWGGFAAPGLLERDPGVLDELVHQVLERSTPRGRVLDQARAIAAWRGAPRLARLRVPTTVIHGDRDPLIPVGNGMRLARLIADAEYVEVPGAGHLLPYEAGDVLIDAIVRRSPATAVT